MGLLGAGAVLMGRIQPATSPEALPEMEGRCGWHTRSAHTASRRSITKKPREYTRLP